MEAFDKDEVVPDVVMSPPPAIIKVRFGDVDVTPGQILNPRQVKDQPTLTWTGDSAAFYTVIMTDPDAPSRKEPKFREWHHWMVCNVPGEEIGQGEVKSTYIGAGPPQGTGLHRYVILVFKQEEKKDFSKHPTLGFSTADRASVKVSDLQSSLGLGPLVAGNFFQAEWDDYVPELYKSMSN